MFFLSLLGITLPIVYYRNYIKEQYQRFQSLQSMVATQYNSKIMIFLVSCKIVGISWYNHIKLTYFVNNAKKIGRNRYSFTYYIEGKRYTMIIEPIKGPKIKSAFDENNQDITGLVMEYLGPRYDQKVTPSLLNKQHIYVQNMEDEMLIFENFDRLIVN